MNLVQTLRQAAALGELDEDEIRTLAAAMLVTSMPDGHAFIRQGERADGCFIILEGEIRMTQEHEGESVEVKRMKPGDLVGLVALIDHGPRTATCTAVGPTTVSWLPAPAFTLLHEGSPDVVLHFQKLVARQLARDARALNEALVRAMLAQRDSHTHGRFSGDFHLSV